jgi:hypothetical protein
MKKRYTHIRKYGAASPIILFSLAGLPAFLGFAYNLMLDILIEHRLRQWTQAGIPTDLQSLKRPPISPGENAAIFYAGIFKDMNLGAKHATGSSMIIPKLIPLLPQSTFFILDRDTWDVRQWDSSRWRELSSLLDSPEIQEAITRLDSASQKSKCFFTVDLDQGVFMVMPHLQSFLVCNRILCTKAMCHSQRNQISRAVNTLLIALRMSRHLDFDRILASQLTKIRCDYNTMACIQQIVDMHTIPASLTRTLISELHLHVNLQAQIDGINGDVANSIWGFKKIIKNELLPFTQVLGLKTFSPATEQLAIFILKPLIKKDFIYFLDTLTEYRSEYTSRKVNLGKFREMNDNLPSYYPLTSVFYCPPLRIFKTTALQHEIHIKSCTIGLALDIHFAKYNTYPKDLIELTSEIPVTSLTDPFNGQRIEYRSSPSGFTLQQHGPLDGIQSPVTLWKSAN